VIEKFKLFVRTKPELSSYVNEGSMTWQKFYEMWNLYGEDSDIWNKYSKKEESSNLTSDNTSNTVSNILSNLKNIDMNEVQKGVESVRKAIDLLQGFIVSDTPSNKTYTPRNLFKKYDD
jgi:hypothetical protein